MTDRRPAWAALVLLVASLGGSPPDDSAKPWAFRPVSRDPVPNIDGASNPIDAFVARRLDSVGLAAAAPADRRTLIRRATFDLIGLPPTPEEVAAFLADDRPDAFARLVDRLLASPHYGERWGRRWLDLVRYAETHGYERDDPKPNAWKYRDWVVSALNRDLPYDRFLVEQLAGDELPDADDSTRTATGMYRLGPIDDEPADPVADRFDQLDDMVKTVGSTMLGLTVHCARCHDHKFDPIKQTDYYRMLAFLTPSRPYVRGDGESISLVLASDSERERVATLNRAVDRQIAQMRERINAIPSDRPPTGAEKALKSSLETAIKRLDRYRPTGLPMTLGLTDSGPEAKPTHLMLRGDAHRPGKVVEPGFLSILDDEAPTISPPEGTHTTGRRLALARWIARPENPLTARVMVNRLWQGHFGVGIVATPSDFGAMGSEPTDPALLDWLASEFVARGWSLKAMHRLMVTSQTYQRAGTWSDEAAEADPDDALQWRHRPQRLEAEPIRDAVLAVSGTLNPAVGGPSVMPEIEKAVLAGQSVPGKGWVASNAADSARRSIYVMAKRTLALPELEVMDAPDGNEPCPRRFVTTTAPQALTLMNGKFFHDQAAEFADRLEREAGDDPKARVDRAFALAFGRAPTKQEQTESVRFLRSQAERIAARPSADARIDPDREALRSFCLALFGANEFLTVD